MNFGEHVHHIVFRLKPENSLRLLPGNLVVPEVLKALDFDCDFLAGQFLNSFLDHIADGTDGVVVGDQVKDTVDALMGLDGPQVAPNRVADVDEGPPDRSVINGDLFFESSRSCTLC